MVGATTSPSPDTIRHTFWSGLEPRPGAALIPLRTTFTYRAADPYAVVLTFRTGRNEWVLWTLARELLGAGLVATSGDGDVSISPDNADPARVWITFRSPSGRAAIAFDRNDLERALCASESIVPLGTEADRIDWTAELARIREVA